MKLSPLREGTRPSLAAWVWFLNQTPGRKKTNRHKIPNPSRITLDEIRTIMYYHFRITSGTEKALRAKYSIFWKDPVKRMKILEHYDPPMDANTYKALPTRSEKIKKLSVAMSVTLRQSLPRLRSGYLQGLIPEKIQISSLKQRRDYVESFGVEPTDFVVYRCIEGVYSNQCVDLPRQVRFGQKPIFQVRIPWRNGSWRTRGISRFRRSTLVLTADQDLLTEFLEADLSGNSFPRKIPSKMFRNLDTRAVPILVRYVSPFYRIYLREKRVTTLVEVSAFAVNKCLESLNHTIAIRYLDLPFAGRGPQVNLDSVEDIGNLLLCMDARSIYGLRLADTRSRVVSKPPKAKSA